MTVWVGGLDYSTGLLRYVNGGYNSSTLLRDGSWEWVKDAFGMQLGLFDSILYDVFERQFEPGGMLYTYTVGVAEAMDVDGNLFEKDRLEEMLFKCMDMCSVGVGMRFAITDITLDDEQSDDIAEVPIGGLESSWRRKASTTCSEGLSIPVDLSVACAWIMWFAPCPTVDNQV